MNIVGVCLVSNVRVSVNMVVYFHVGLVYARGCDCRDGVEGRGLMGAGIRHV